MQGAVAPVIETIAKANVVHSVSNSLSNAQLWMRTQCDSSGMQREQSSKLWSHACVNWRRLQLVFTSKCLFAQVTHRLLQGAAGAAVLAAVAAAQAGPFAQGPHRR